MCNRISGGGGNLAAKDVVTVLSAVAAAFPVCRNFKLCVLVDDPATEVLQEPSRDVDAALSIEEGDDRRGTDRSVGERPLPPPDLGSCTSCVEGDRRGLVGTRFEGAKLSLPLKL